MSEIANIRREISELTEASQAVVALVNTNTEALASANAQLADALARVALTEAELAEFNGIAAQLDTVEQGLRSVLPVAPVEPQPEPEVPTDPETPTEPVEPAPETPTEPTPETPVEPQPEEPAPVDPAPVVEEPVAETPVEEQPAAPVEEQPAAPAEGEAAPVEGTDPNAQKPAV